MLSEMPRLKIRSNFDLSYIDHLINEALPACSKWGDLEITREEYDNINSRIRDHLGEVPSFSSLIYVCKRYPSVLVTSLVGFARYEYSDTFWDAWTKLFKVRFRNDQSVQIGRLVLDHLKKNDFEVIEEEGYTYVSPILYQAGIPAGSFSRLFSVIASTLGSSFFTPREIVIELTGNRSNLIDAAVRRYFERNQEAALETVGDLQEMMRVMAAFSEDTAPESFTWEERVLEQYWKWRDEDLHSKRKRTLDHQIYFSPRLVHDEIRGICLKLPEQILQDDSLYRLRWEIRGSDPYYKQICWSDVHQVAEKNITQSSLVAVPPQEEYTVTIHDDDSENAASLYPMWTLPGINEEEPVLTFDSQGRQLAGDGYLQRNRGTAAVWKRSGEIGIEKAGVSGEELFLQKSWNAFKGTRVYPLENFASFRINTVTGSRTLSFHQVIDFELSKEPTLFDEPYREDETPVFTRFPNLEILGPLNANHRFLKEGQLILRCRDNGQRHTVKLLDLRVSRGQDFSVIDLRDWALQEFSGRFGSYSLSVYEGRTNRGTFGFYYAPVLPFRSDIKSLCSPNELITSKPAFFIAQSDNGRVHFDEPDLLINEMLIDGSPWIRLRRRDNKASLNGMLKLNDQIEIPFRKTLRQLEWNFWPESGEMTEDQENSRIFSLIDLKSSLWRMELRFTDPSIYYDQVLIQLTGDDGALLQVKELKPDHRGRCYMTLNLFQDTIQANELPQRLLLVVRQGQEEYQPVPLAAFRHFVQLKDPRYMTARGRPVIIWQKGDYRKTSKLKLKLIALSDPSRQETVEQSLDKLQSFTKKGRSFHGVYLDAPLQDGVYFIDTVEEDPFAFFEEETAISYDSHHILFVNAEEYLMAHYVAKSREAGKWLAAAVVAQYKLEWIEELFFNLRTLLAEKGYKNAWHFDVQKSSEMLFSAVLSTFGPSDFDPEARNLMREIYQSISEEVITTRQRTRLLQILSESSFTTAEIRYLIQELQLYLFMPDGETLFCKKQLHRIWGIHEKLAILINIRDSAENPRADIGRIIHHLGEDTLKSVITIRSQNCGSYTWAECFECLILNQGNCPGTRFKYLERVTGDGEEFTKLFSVSSRLRDSVIRTPTQEDTRGFPVLGKTYLDLFFQSCQAHDHKKSRDYYQTAMTWVPQLDEISARHERHTQEVEAILARRRNSANNIGLLFFEIGRASLFTALETRGTIQQHETKKLLPFWRVAKSAYPELVYRDLIMAELYTITEGGR